MDAHLVFNMVICFLVIVLVLSLFKVCLDTMCLNKLAQNSYLSLRENIQKEEQKQRFYSDQLLLIDELNKSLYNRIFQISKDFILMQKVIFGKDFNRMT
jgi:hypothetical protein